MRGSLRLLGALLLLYSGCKDTINGECNVSGDCPADHTCLYDLDRSESYCTQVCEQNSDCPAHQLCRSGTDSMSSPDHSDFCVDKIRVCGGEELCNGLDDNCDGVVDEVGCKLITGCTDDRGCGTFICQAPEGQPSTVCGPRSGTAQGVLYSRCSRGDECANNVCETGWCSPLCAARDVSACPTFVNARNMEQLSVCARAVGSDTRPRYNTCQLTCGLDGDCLEGQSCVWRTVVGSADDHYSVCSSLDPGRAALGSACSNNFPDQGDDECQRGLCYGFVCTRFCGGPGSSCDDVGTGFSCHSTDLIYGPHITPAFVCVK